MTTTQNPSPVQLHAADAPGQPTPTPALEELYRGFEKELLVPLWTEIGDLMPAHPQSKAQPHLWRWNDLLPLAERAGELVPVGRGGERRAIALANPSLGGRPFVAPTLWAAIQYLMPGEDAPEHRHTQHAFRFVVEGEGVWTVVGRDPVPMRRGDFLPQAGLELARAPQRHRQADGVDRRPGHPVPVRLGGTVLRVRPRRDQRRGADHPRPLALRAALGPPGAAPVGAPRPAPARPCSPTAGSTPTAPWPTSSSSRPRGSPGRSSPATPSSASPTRAPGSTCCPPSAPRCTASAAAPRPLRSARSARRSTRSSTAPAPSPSAPSSGPSPAATCSSSRRGSRSASAPRPAHRLRLRRARPVPVQRHPHLRGPPAAPLRDHPLTPPETHHDPQPKHRRREGSS